MGLLRFLLVIGAIVGTSMGAGLAHIRREPPGALAVFTPEAGENAYRSQYFYQEQVGLVHIHDENYFFGTSADQKGFLYSPEKNTQVYELRTDGTQREIFNAPLEAVEFVGTSPDGQWYLFMNNLTFTE
jgi:hypothetical protein